VLLVGKEEMRIICHKTLLGYFSKFFESALYGGFSEATETEIALPEEQGEQMKEFVGWLYSGQSAFDTKVEKALARMTADAEKFNTCNGEEIDCAHGQVYSGLLQEDYELELFMESLWIVADKLLCPSFANHVMKQLLQVN
jgi:hypothetical protein